MTAPAAARTGADDWNRNERDIIEACVRAASVSPDLRAAALAELARLRAAHQTQQDALKEAQAAMALADDCLCDHLGDRAVAEAQGRTFTTATYVRSALDYLRRASDVLAAVPGTENTETEER